ncbi:MAG: 2-phospho-L-lactate guanylyltransferase [Halobacteriota archaeon]
MAAKVKAIIPFKKKGAKSRLGSFLSEQEREELAIRMLTDVLTALSESEVGKIEVIITCTRNELLNGLKTSHRDLKSKLSIREDGRELNELLNGVISAEKEPVLIIMADIPLATAEAINELLRHDEDVVVMPGRNGGTNALFLRRPHDFTVSYYGISCLAHIATAKSRNLSHAVYDSFRIGVDIDEVEDLIELLIHGRCSASTEYLRGIGVRLRVDKAAKVRVGVERET